MANYTRRRMLSAAGGLAACAALPRSAYAGEEYSLDRLAQKKGLRFGTAISAAQVADPRYTEITLRDCGVLVAENEHKWYTILPEPDRWNFAPGDAIAGFAKQHGLGLRGHTLVWHHPRWLPNWVNALEFSSAAEAEAALGAYIERVAQHYHPQIYSWDVVNETVDDKTGALRETSFSKAMGPEIIDFCFHKAKETAPGATLAYNDYMSWERGNENHRKGVLRLLERLKKNGAPIDALGIQSHSNYDMPNEFTKARQREWRKFVDEVVGMGLEIYLTEFDVNDTRLGPDKALRDRLIAQYTKEYLDLMLSYEQVKDVLMWGMVDHQSWLQDFLPRNDGVAKRPTVYDENYQPKAMRTAIADALKAAPARPRGPGFATE